MSGRSVVPDAHLLVLYVLGSADPSTIGRHRRLRVFELDDLQLLNRELASYDHVFLLPNVLTEVSNLIGHSGDQRTTAVASNLRALIGASSEVYVPSIAVTDRFHFTSLGLTDSVLIHMSRQGHVILTMDAPLCAAVWSEGGDATNFNALRAARLFD